MDDKPGAYRTRAGVEEGGTMKTSKILGVVLACICCLVLISCEAQEGQTGQELLYAPSGWSAQLGRDYQDVVSDFEAQGFTNIRTEMAASPADGEPVREGAVETVTIAGDAEYLASTGYPEDAEIVITYYGATAVQQPEDSESPAETGAPEAAAEPSVSQEPESSEPLEEEAEPPASQTPEAPVAPSQTTLPAEPSQPAPSGTPEPSGGGISGETNGTETQGGGGTGVTVPQPETGDNLVWVPTKGGTKYHTSAGCSGMIDPIQVTLETALANGYEPCKRCH